MAVEKVCANCNHPCHCDSTHRIEHMPDSPACDVDIRDEMFPSDDPNRLDEPLLCSCIACRCD